MNAINSSKVRHFAFKVQPVACCRQRDLLRLRTCAFALAAGGQGDDAEQTPGAPGSLVGNSSTTGWRRSLHLGFRLAN